MILRQLRSHFRDRALAVRLADQLIACHGERAWLVARARAFRALNAAHRVDLAWNVVHLVERRLKVYRQPDTATRYHDRSSV